MNYFSVSHTRGALLSRRLHLHPLAACLALAFSTCASSVGSQSSEPALLAGSAQHPVHRLAMRTPSATLALAHVVNTCDDAPVLPICDGKDDGTLRKAYFCAQNNDTIDLTQLTCSKITLSAPLTSSPVTLSLYGPGKDKLAIDGAGQFRVLVHNGGPYDGLYVNGLTITNGRYDSPYDDAQGGGCIFSSGNVFVNYSVVSSCFAESPYGVATGGAIYAKGTADLYHSSVTSSTASGGYQGLAVGGGVHAHTVDLNRSTISGNTATSSALSIAGGVSAQTIYAYYSTISGNSAAGGGGAFADRAYLTDSTISGNHADYGPFGGLYARYSAQVFSSTIAGNTSAGDSAAGLYVRYASTLTTILHNTIIANNTTGGIESDVSTGPGLTISGSNNLIMAHPIEATVPADTISADPKLGPLQDNGGPTRTMALKAGSPAIDKGGVTGLHADQRGSKRVIGSNPDIGAFELDPDVVFANGFNL
jgi:hypothetical protein